MLRFLLDANLSPETAAFLRQQFSFDVASIMELGQTGLRDPEIIALAKREKRVIITLDLDFGELYHDAESQASFGVLILRLRDQRVESINQVLQKFFTDPFGKNVFTRNPHALVVLDESTFRIAN